MKKQILLLNYEFPPLGGGASPVSFELAKILSETNQYEIDVITMGYKAIPIYEEVNQNFHIYRVKCLRSKKSSCSPLEQLTYLISAYFQARTLLRKKKYNFCHCHFIFPTGVLAWVLKKQFFLPYFISAHGSDVPNHTNKSRFLHKILSPLWRQITRESYCIFSPSEILKTRIQKAFKKTNIQQKIKIIPHGIFSPQREEGEEKNQIILIVARLLHYKKVQDVLRAIQDIDLQNWKVQIVGDGPYKNNLEILLPKGKNIELLGWMDRDSEEFKNLYKKASLFISASEVESFGLGVLEALSHGCYPLLSDIPAHRSIVKGDKYFFPVGDIGTLASKIEDTIRQKNISFDEDISRFLWKNISQQYIAQFEKTQ